MADRVIQLADLSNIESNLNAINVGIKRVDTSVASVDSNLRVVYDELGALAKDFQEYVVNEKRRWELEHATTKLGNVRQQLEKKYGHYSEVRRTTMGILQATDLGIVRNESITSAAEDLMLSCPEYWLAPCLVALAAWINDKKDIAEKALKEAIRRDDEKTSLLFGLICRRANRQDAALKWVKRYLANQDPEKLGRETIVILDAYASGLFAASSGKAISEQLANWIDLLSSRPGFLEEQTDRWKAALKDKRKPISDKEYTYLRKYSKTWTVLEDIMEGARSHATILSYFEGIFAQPSSQEAVKKQLDDILTSLVTGFDDEELPLHREERLCELIIQYYGDVARAQKSANVEKASMEVERDFTQLLTDAAMYPEISHASTSSQKFAIAYSNEWIRNGYGDTVAENRMNIPDAIEINIDTFNDSTQDGTDEDRLVNSFEALVEKEREDELAKSELTTFERFCQYGGIACILIGVLAFILSQIVVGALALVAGVGLILKYFSRKKIIDTQRDSINAKYDEKKSRGIKLLKATIAEIVDFRAEFALEDAKSKQVFGFLDELASDEYIEQVAGNSRRVISSKAN